MHTPTERKRPLTEGFTLSIPAPNRGNLFSIGQQIAQAAMADKRMARRKMKAKRKQRQWKGD